MAVAKRIQRMNSGGGGASPRKIVVQKFRGGVSDSPHGKVSAREIFDLIKDNQRLIEKLIDKL